MEYPDHDRTQMAVLGSPIAHSLSPTLHAAAYEVLGLPFTYGRHEVASGGLGTFLGTLGPEWRGLSLTMPLKREVIPFLDSTTPLVDALGVANTLAFRAEHGTLVRAGANTDVDGIVRIVETAGVPGTEAAIVGGGATAASAIAACCRCGVTLIRLFLRTPAKARPLTDLAARFGVRAEVHALGELDAHSPLQFAVSTLPGGAADLLPLEPAGQDALLLDVAYEPWPTAIAQRWSAGGGRLLSGLDMLVEQALGQLRFFLLADDDRALPDEPAVRRAMRLAVGLSPHQSTIR